MSRTRKTDPLWVRMLKGTIHVYAIHNHENGECDLKPLEDKGEDWWRGNCHWEFDSEGKGVCCCKLCRGFGWKDTREPKIQRKHFKNIVKKVDFDNM